MVLVVNGFLQSKTSRSSNAMNMMAEKSKALPFLNRPAKLDGTVIGDFGFVSIN